MEFVYDYRIVRITKRNDAKILHRFVNRSTKSETRFFLTTTLTEEFIGSDRLPRFTTKNSPVTDVFFVVNLGERLLTMNYSVSMVVFTE